MGCFREIHQFTAFCLSVAVLGHFCGVTYLWSLRLPVAQSLFCLASTMGELGLAIWAGNFKDVFWFTFCYNEVNANCFYVIFLKFILLIFGRGRLRGVSKDQKWFNMVLAWLEKKNLTDVHFDSLFSVGIDFSTIFQILFRSRFVLVGGKC